MSPPPGVASAEPARAVPQAGLAPEAAAEQIRQFLKEHQLTGAVLEDGNTLFELNAAECRVTTEYGRCMLQLWSQERQLVRTVEHVELRRGALRLLTRRFGHDGTSPLLLVARVERREPASREPARRGFLRLLQRALAREFTGWELQGFRTAMDLERSFGPAYARGMLTRGKESWAVIGVSLGESQALIDGVLTLGILWLHWCRERGDGRRIVKGLRVIVPKGLGSLTLARLPWLHAEAAQWEMWELDEATEQLLERDPADQGNLRTRLIQHPDEEAARERFADAVAQVYALVQAPERARIEQRLRSPAELAFLLHGLEFARARISLAAGSFAQTLEISVGAGAQGTVLKPGNLQQVKAHVEELFARRCARALPYGRTLRPSQGAAIGAFTGRPAHARSPGGTRGMERLEARARARAAQQDPLFRAHPERWLESVLRENLAPLTRSLGGHETENHFEAPFSGNADSFGNLDISGPYGGSFPRTARRQEQLIARFDPRYVYTQVPAIVGAGDRGMLDLLGVTDDGRLAVIEIKTSDDLHLALQGLDYWIRVRHHHRTAQDSGQGFQSNDLQRHGYFRGVELSPRPPRLFLVAPALHIHPETEKILRYLSPQVEWHLLALDERWRQEIRVVWRKKGGQPCS